MAIELLMCRMIGDYFTLGNQCWLAGARRPSGTNVLFGSTWRLASVGAGKLCY